MAKSYPIFLSRGAVQTDEHADWISGALCHYIFDPLTQEDGGDVTPSSDRGCSSGRDSPGNHN
jgi:hypothetical protein